jgi:hypothetical protein
MGPNQPKKEAFFVLSCLKMGIYKTAVSKELKIRIEKTQSNLSNVKGRPQDPLVKWGFEMGEGYEGPHRPKKDKPLWI